MLTILTILGNGLLIYLITSRKRLHSTVNWFLFSLALADLCVGLTFFPTRTVCNQSAALCNKCITTALRWLFLNLSVTNLCALSVDRYIAIVMPFKYAVFTAKKRHFFLIAAAWILPFVGHFVPFTWMYCVGMKSYLIFFYMVVLFIFKILPFLLLFATCLKTLHSAHKQKNRIAVQLSQLMFNGFSCRLHSQASTFAKALGIIVAIFFICYAIDIARLICYTFQCTTHIPWLLVQVQALLFICNSASNPLVYAFLKQDIQQEVKLFLKCLGS